MKFLTLINLLSALGFVSVIISTRDAYIKKEVIKGVIVIFVGLSILLVSMIKNNNDALASSEVKKNRIP